jgi:hypothetical protein
MTKRQSTAGERRDTTRQPTDAQVEVLWVEPGVVGSGQNISDDGVYFVTPGPVRVRVRVEGVELDGELVRAQSLDGSQTGIAVRFAPS